MHAEDEPAICILLLLNAMCLSALTVVVWAFLTS